MTHKALVERAARWLRNTQRCSVVLTELMTSTGEIPDAIGWHGPTSTLVECKASRSDFLRDKNKCHQRSGWGVGYHRYYLVPPGLIKPDEVPPRWGLLECGERTVKVVRRPTHTLRNKYATMEEQETWRQSREITMLVSALRRVQAKATK